MNKKNRKRTGSYLSMVGLLCAVVLIAGCYRYSGEIDEALFALRITEIHYHPLASDGYPDDSLEFIELKNTGSTTVDLSTCSFTNGVSYVFGRGERVYPDRFFILASNSSAFQQRYGFAPDGVYDRKLGNGQDTLVLTDDYSEQEVLSQPYADSSGWPVEADGFGYSLVPVAVTPSRNPIGPDGWRRSVGLYGSPGADDIPETVDPALYDLRITEIHYHPDAPDSLEQDSLEFIELKNTGSSVIPLGKVALTRGISCTFAENAMLAPGSFFVITSSRNGFMSRYGREPDALYSGKLSNKGETIVVEVPASADILLTVTYSDDAPWPVTPDGDGYSLVSVSMNPPEDQNDPALWQPSYAIGGSPFTDDPASRR